MKSKNAEFIGKVIDDIQDFYTVDNSFDCIKALSGAMTVSETFMLAILLDIEDEDAVKAKIELLLESFKKNTLYHYKLTKNLNPKA